MMKSEAYQAVYEMPTHWSDIDPEHDKKHSRFVKMKARGFMTVNGSRAIMKRTKPRRGLCHCSAGTSKKSSKQPSKTTDISNGNRCMRSTSEPLSK